MDERPLEDDAPHPPDPRGLLAFLARLEHRWKYGPQLYWYVTRPLWWARWHIWLRRYWRAVSFLDRSGAFAPEDEPLPEELNHG